MPKSPEQFDFSREEEQKRLEDLSEEKRAAFIEKQIMEAERIKEKVKSGEAKNYKEASALVEQEIVKEKEPLPSLVFLYRGDNLYIERLAEEFEAIGGRVDIVNISNEDYKEAGKYFSAFSWTSEEQVKEEL